MKEEILKRSSALASLIEEALRELEEQGDIVICASNIEKIVSFLYLRFQTLIPSEEITPSELTGLRSLILQATSDERFFDWEMPTLTGLNTKEFQELAEKLPKG